MLVAGLRPRERDGPLVPLVPIRWLAVGGDRCSPCGRIALNVVDSHVIDIGVAGVIGADHIAHGQSLYYGRLRPGLGIRGDVYGPFNYLAYLPFEAIFPWNGHWGDVPAAHAAAIVFDLLTALGLLALGRRLRRGRGRHGARGRARLRLARLPVHPLHDERQRERFADRGARSGAMLALASPPGRGALVALAHRGQVRLGRARAAVRDRDRRAAVALGASSSRIAFGVVARPAGRSHSCPTAAGGVLRPHARLPGVAELAVQRLGPGALARLPEAGRARRRPSRWRSRSPSGRAERRPRRSRRWRRRC